MGTLYAYGWKNLNSYVPGWPVHLHNDICEVSPASGDIDQDGEVEAVFMTRSRLFIFDTNSPVDRTNARRQWPMYAYNPQRTGCLACAPDVVTGAGPVIVDVAMRLEASPNPASGPVAFRIELPQRAAVRLEIHDVAGRRVRSVLKRELEPGLQHTIWDGNDAQGRPLPGGIYYAQLRVSGRSGSTTLARRVALIR